MGKQVREGDWGGGVEKEVSGKGIGVVACVAFGTTTLGLVRVLEVGEGIEVRSTTVGSGEEWGRVA